MSQWYLSKGGKAVGPLSEEKIIELISRGELSHLDLVYQTGGAEWLSLSQVDVFKKHLGQQEPQHDKGQGEPEWVLLKKIKKDEESKYEQLGPFAESEVLKWLDRGEIKFTDFAWKKGLDSWVRISELEAFSKPLPSSSKIDRDLYEPTQALEAETLTKGLQKQSLSQVVHIERFDPEKTQVTRESSMPINNQDFVTESELTGVSEDVNLWSLEPPGSKGAKPEVKKEKASPQLEDLKPPPQNLKKAAEHRKKSAAFKKKSRSKSSRASSKETLQLIGALCAFALAFVFLYLSFTSDKEPISGRGDRSSFSSESATAQLSANPNTESVLNSRSDLGEKVRKFKEMAAKAEREREKIKQRETIQAQAQKPQKQPRVAATKAIRPTSAFAQKTKPVVVAAKKIKSGMERAPIVKTKKLPIPGKKNMVSAKKSLPAKVSAPPSLKKRAVTTAASVKVSTSTGSAKSQSFFKQRDRLALFYSSLKGETLAVEIQSQFKKLQKNKAAWARYYGQWRKKVRSSLAQDIRTFPNQNKTYAYPQIMASFKKDYELIYKYGETFDLRVKGVRVPSGSPRDMRSLFAKYRKQALRLGR